ncbi:CHAP domain-containing protein [Lactococcus garvieae]|uniref:CHAP domain-containing protein n=1 Tax=Lactococcus garvieae TaxID=1363 RepID=UPI003852CB94
MYNVAATIGPLVGKQVGYSSSAGQCGALASYWLSVLTDKVYQFAYGMSGINAKWVPDSDCVTAWNVFTQTNWSAIGFEKIDNPSFSQLKAGDIFFISARDGLSTGHVGIVASVANGNVVTYEQNVLGIMVVQELPNDNSWSWYNGFSGVVRKKEEKPPTDGNSNNNNNTSQKEEKMIRSVRDEKGNISVFNMNTMKNMEYMSPKMWGVFQRVYAQKDASKPVQLNQAEVSGLAEMFKSPLDKKNVI